ncbi:MAG: hypothetical protein JOS17DRAFT_755912 [Linnemannia elongata]|nr:MAG: hypothetical protein JOS17DRAFT_755912 [Linnemannia elongata]
MIMSQFGRGVGVGVLVSMDPTLWGDTFLLLLHVNLTQYVHCHSSPLTRWGFFCVSCAFFFLSFFLS